jgi:hypothetical protein
MLDVRLVVFARALARLLLLAPQSVLWGYADVIRRRGMTCLTLRGIVAYFWAGLRISAARVSLVITHFLLGISIHR